MKKSLLALGLSLLLTACGGDKSVETPKAEPTSTTTSASTNVPNGEALNVIASINPPFVTKDERGIAIGFDVEIIQEIAKRENLNLNIISRASWDGALDTLDTSEGDIVISAVTLNPERSEKYLASKTYVSTPNTLVVVATSPILSINDLAGKVVGVEQGASLAKDKDKYPNTEFKEFKTSYLALTEVIRKNIDAAAGQKLHMQYLLKDNKDATVRFIDLPSAYPDKVIMVKKGNTELIDKINSGLDKIKADGTYDEIYQKWFGDDDIAKIAPK